MTGFLTFFRREVARFLFDALATIAPPTVSVVLFLLIFGAALGPHLGSVEGVPYAQFMFPGLLLLAVAMNSFLNPAYSVFQSRWDGNIFDILSSPLSSSQGSLAVILAGMVRGLIVGGLVALVGWLLTGVQWVSPLLTGLYLLGVSLLFASLGSIVGLWTKGWEGVNAITVFVLEPLVLLGGVFYSLKMVQDIPVLNALTQLNPLTTITGGLRAIMLGAGDVSWAAGFFLTIGLSALFLPLSLVLFWRGYHLKS